MQRHSPVKPLWFCAACARGWPCGQAKLDLLAEYTDRKTLAVDLVDLYLEALHDLDRLGANPDDVEVYGRFLGWLRTAKR